MNTNTRNIVLSGLFLALCLILPQLVGLVPEIGAMLSPMHIPVYIAGFVCGPIYAGIVGFMAPFLKMQIYGVPPITITIPMAFEMMTYGFVVGIIYTRLNRKSKIGVYITLISSMIFGRLVYGTVKYLILFTSFSSSDIEFSFKGLVLGMFQQFLLADLISASPGLICHLILVPIIIIMTEKYTKSSVTPLEFTK